MFPFDPASVGKLADGNPLEVRLCSPRDVGVLVPGSGLQLVPRIRALQGDFARFISDTLVLANARLTQTDSDGLKPHAYNTVPYAEVALALSDNCGVQRKQIDTAETTGRTVAGFGAAAVTLCVVGIAVIVLIMKAQGTNIGG